MALARAQAARAGASMSAPIAVAWYELDAETIAGYSADGQLCELRLLGDISRQRIQELPLAKLQRRPDRPIEVLVEEVLCRERLDRNQYAQAGDFYEAVALVYAQAVRSGKPTKKLAEWGDVPRSTAARWVREARNRGALPTPRHGKVW